MENPQPFLLRNPRSVDDFVIRRKAFTYYELDGKRRGDQLINLRRPGVLHLD
jgi:hypothetical protein